MKCTHTSYDLSLYMDKELSENELELFNDHLNQCTQCKESIEIYSEIIDQYNQLEVKRELPPNYHNQLMIKIKKLSKHKKTKMIKKLPQFKYVATLVIMIVLTMILSYDMNTKDAIMTLDHSVENYEIDENIMHSTSDALRNSSHNTFINNKSDSIILVLLVLIVFFASLFIIRTLIKRRDSNEKNQ
ncbi:hypothetical protein EDC19_0623 [Natranaerovirga hydrolytica]|uniref:Putative zinc-finger domain-containing protein n=1 Tax=Natranaerovirga hydrolytica TaxID=680378 RepID=A0A4R1MYJ6_9FIRM|nr:zf-HC2 domain-containing protein [Natranaerovirga hydrolytica]TCK98205.1 hypothetical protein EDC19_0623 [Natranaerovirga hydrolytica]